MKIKTEKEKKIKTENKKVNVEKTEKRVNKTLKDLNVDQLNDVKILNSEKLEKTNKSRRKLEKLSDSLGVDISLIIAGSLSAAAGLAVSFAGMAVDNENLILSGVSTFAAGAGLICSSSVIINANISGLGSSITEKITGALIKRQDQKTNKLNALQRGVEKHLNERPL